MKTTSYMKSPNGQHLPVMNCKLFLFWDEESQLSSSPVPVETQISEIRKLTTCSSSSADNNHHSAVHPPKTFRLPQTIAKEIQEQNIVQGFKYEDWSAQKEFLSYAQLMDIEETRNRLVDRQKDLSAWRIGTSFVGTVFPRLLRSRTVWGILLLYSILRILLQKRILVVGGDLPMIGSAIGTIGGFMSFFLVFYLSQAYTRFMAQYDCCKVLEGRLYNLTYLARIALPPAEAWRLIRCMNASQLTGYIGIGTVYSYTNCFLPMNAKFKLLTEQEVKRLHCMTIGAGGGVYRELLAWSMDIVITYFKQCQERQSTIRSMRNE